MTKTLKDCLLEGGVRGKTFVDGRPNTGVNEYETGLFGKRWIGTTSYPRDNYNKKYRVIDISQGFDRREGTTDLILNVKYEGKEDTDELDCLIHWGDLLIEKESQPQTTT